MLREYYLSSKQYLLMLKCYLRFTGCLSIVWINVHMNFRFIFGFNQKKINTTNVWRFLTEPLDITSITLYLHTLRVFCLSPNFNVKTLYSLSRERWIAFVVVIHCLWLRIYSKTRKWRFDYRATTAIKNKWQKKHSAVNINHDNLNGMLKVNYQYKHKLNYYTDGVKTFGSPV